MHIISCSHEQCMQNMRVNFSYLCSLKKYISLYYLQTFEAKMHHLETRLGLKPKDGLQDLEYFVRCEVHLSDVNTLVSSLRRIADDVRTTGEVKCKHFCHYRLHFRFILCNANFLVGLIKDILSFIYISLYIHAYFFF